MTFSTRVLRFRQKDKHAALLRELAREVNFVWNFVNELSLKVNSRMIRNSLPRNGIAPSEVSERHSRGLSVGKSSALCEAFHKAEIFLVGGRGNAHRHVVGPDPRPVIKKMFVLNRSTGGGRYGH